MKAVILAGGLGTRFSEETDVRPKPMITIGEYPMLWHIMKIYSTYGVNDFIICLGYKGYIIKEYFANYFLHMSDVTFNMADNSIDIHTNTAEPWKVTLVDTGEHSMTGGRLKRVKEYIGNETFCFTYGDGVGNINITELIDFHNASGQKATLTATQPPGRFGSLSLKNNSVTSFMEKPQGDGRWVNGGFFVLEPSVFDYLDDDTTVWENEPLDTLAREGELGAYRHFGYWQPMDTLRDKNSLEKRWVEGNAPWRVWE